MKKGSFAEQYVAFFLLFALISFVTIGLFSADMVKTGSYKHYTNETEYTNETFEVETPEYDLSIGGLKSIFSYSIQAVKTLPEIPVITLLFLVPMGIVFILLLIYMFISGSNWL